MKSLWNSPFFFSFPKLAKREERNAGRETLFLISAFKADATLHRSHRRNE
jgi:hypothetical protein